MSTSGIASRFLRAEISVRAAALSFHTLLGIVPVTALIFFYLRTLGIAKSSSDLLRNYLLSHLNVGSSEVFLRNFQSITSAAQSRGASLFGFFILLYTSTSLMVKLGRSLDTILENSNEHRRWNDTLGANLTLRSNSRAFAMLILRRMLVLAGLPLAMLLSVLAASWIQRDSLLHGLFEMESVGPYLAIPIPVLIDIAMLFAMYQFIPRFPPPWKSSLRAASLAGPLFAIAKFGMGYYGRTALLSLKFYGALATLLVFMLWVHLVWIILLSGALLIHRTDPYSLAAKR
ncbi:MAG: YihY/virulence factor BrkB family protein [Bdellovibrionales bacterium]|nr:YihY/virulence factor BrkB family protein [Bdellovibrionales bacterium]